MLLIAYRSFLLNCVEKTASARKKCSKFYPGYNGSVYSTIVEIFCYNFLSITFDKKTRIRDLQAITRILRSYKQTSQGKAKLAF